MALIRRKGIVRGKSKKRVKRANKVPSISKLMKRCDTAFSLLVRNRGASGDGVNVCYTCGYVASIKKLQCSHYLSRYYKAARWNFDNARPACFMCNIWKKGDLVNFRRRLIAEIGQKRVNDVEKLRDAPIKLSREYLTELLASLTT